MIKCIASDVDGTLLLEGTKELNPEYFDVIKKCKEKGITFILASGRQYISLKRTFLPVLNDVIFICDNGAYVKYQEEALAIHSIPRDVVEDAVEFLRKQEDIYFQISTPSHAYTECEDLELIDQFEKGYQIDITRVDNMLEVTDPVIKIAVYNITQDVRKLANITKDLFEERADVVVSGEKWFDFVAKDISKGYSLQEILDEKGIKKEECMAFGDNDNDIPMLACAKHSYAVATARNSLKKVASAILPEGKDVVLQKIKEIV
ncbi:MAG: HAD family hydrolase [Bacillota bacterium]|nr:HAD family hydrolase [Bacillota bacterium]